MEVLPLSLQMDGKTYRNYLDGRDIGFQEFYARIRDGELATTSAVNVGEFEAKMREILKTGKDILSISFSSALSTTYQSSVIAAEELKGEFPDARILTVDSLCASLGQGLFVWLCAQEQKKGKTIDEVKAFAEETKLTRLPLVHGGRPEPPEAGRPHQRRHGAVRHHAVHQAGDARG